jgi:hypothetical protein
MDDFHLVVKGIVKLVVEVTLIAEGFLGETHCESFFVVPIIARLAMNYGSGAVFPNNGEGTFSAVRQNRTNCERVWRVFTGVTVAVAYFFVSYLGGGNDVLNASGSGDAIDEWLIKGAANPSLEV